MAGLPKLPGLSFTDPTQTRFHKSATFDIINGYTIPKSNFLAPGGRELESNSVKYIQKSDPVRFDPSLTYGRTRSKPLPQFIPNYALYDKKCLTFNAFFKQSVVESPLEHFRIRIVNIIYFLEDDTISVMEPRVINSGLDQGKLIRRQKIPKYITGEVYTWKDFAVGKDLCFYGVVYHTVDCDLFTREYMASQGLIMDEPEQMPTDLYTQQRKSREGVPISKTPSADDNLRRFLEYDGKVLKFKAVWDDRDSEYGELRKYEVLYFLADDGISVKEVHEKNDGRDPFPLLLRKTKLPKIYTDRPVTFPSIYYETSDAEVVEYYNPQDLKVGETIFILGRKFLLYDCDESTRNYYKKVFCIDQNAAIDITEKPKRQPPEKVMPPHDGFGSLEDSLQNTLTFMPKTPKKDVIRQILNANKYLRYTMVMDTVHPEDSIRNFVLSYSLADSTCKIHEPPINNSGFKGGQYLSNYLLVVPGSDPLNPDYYSPAHFHIGALITVFKQRFIITGADLYVYRYMLANSDKFPCEVIDNLRNYMYNKGYLNDDVKDQFQENMEAAKIDYSGKLETQMRRSTEEKEIKKTDMEKCLELVKAGGGMDPEEEARIRAGILQEYEDSLKREREIMPYGIKPVNESCRYPVVIGDIKSSVCPEDETNTATYTPKHIDTPEEKVEKYYAKVLKKEHHICTEKQPVECLDQPPYHIATRDMVEQPTPLMVQPPDLPPGACNVKQVRFADSVDRCEQDKYNMCNLGHDRTHCDCTDYQKKC
ncbi:unnamed protein product [Brassicogethes aeneus]|uniref:DM10 domain-containing protein n=1 Tax=Brassicogethes aeneus TaxID=1431903 RepID=A0A9P0B6Z8_BRAAE|nr:unnamed protein product [Brassicogethes aeneus]